MQRSRSGTATLLLLGAIVGAFAATAQTAPQPARRATIDANSDGVLDEPELRTAAESTFKKADANGDGYLTADELRAARMAGDVERRTRGLGAVLGAQSPRAETPAERFERLDADNDGRIAKKEFVDAPHPLMRFDADGDGLVTRKEIQQAQNGRWAGVL